MENLAALHPSGTQHTAKHKELRCSFAQQIQCRDEDYQACHNRPTILDNKPSPVHQLINAVVDVWHCGLAPLCHILSWNGRRKQEKNTNEPRFVVCMRSSCTLDH